MAHHRVAATPIASLDCDPNIGFLISHGAAVDAFIYQSAANSTPVIIWISHAEGNVGPVACRIPLFSVQSIEHPQILMRRRGVIRMHGDIRDQTNLSPARG